MALDAKSLTSSGATPRVRAARSFNDKNTPLTLDSVRRVSFDGWIECVTLYVNGFPAATGELFLLEVNPEI